MPAIKRTRTVDGAPDEVWRTVGDPFHLSRWWPMVERVEQVSAGGFTTVMRTAKGSAVRADHRLIEHAEPARVAWEQDIEGTPFERVLRSQTVEVSLEPAPSGTNVVLVLHQRLRGTAALGGYLVRRAAIKQIDEALDGLERLFDRRSA